MLRQAGQLSHMEQVFTTLEKFNSSTEFNFSKGLVNRYQGKFKVALEEFSIASSNLKLQESCYLQMIMVYLYVGGVFKVPSKKAFFQKKSSDSTKPAFDKTVSDVLSMELKKQHSNDATVYSREDSGRLAIQQSASDLLSRIPDAYFTDTRLRGIYDTYCKLIGQDKRVISDTFSFVFDTLKDDLDWFPGALCLAVCHVHNNAIPKARTVLKKLCKQQRTEEYSEEFEISCLFLAQLYIQSNKYEYALELCDKVLSYNKSCSLAWELKGDIDEQDHAYRDAAINFDRSWQNGGQESSTVGYKLAFNYLKAEDYIRAIEVCHKVLDNNSTYDAIYNDVLMKAKEALKP
ncbi:hypothetical protein GEMRC1_006802 [Eukaryota sp. GEM-RC1]